jgi:hypothetical protein
MPRVTKQQRLVPLCDAAAQCTSCGSLQAFIENERALELPMVLSKKGLVHVQQTVGWLVAPQGGSWALQMDVAAGGCGVTQCWGSLGAVLWKCHVCKERRGSFTTKMMAICCYAWRCHCWVCALNYVRGDCSRFRHGAGQHGCISRHRHLPKPHYPC